MCRDFDTDLIIHMFTCLPCAVNRAEQVVIENHLIQIVPWTCPKSDSWLVTGKAEVSLFLSPGISPVGRNSGRMSQGHTEGTPFFGHLLLSWLIEVTWMQRIRVTLSFPEQFPGTLASNKTPKTCPLATCFSQQPNPRPAYRHAID